MYSVIKRCRKAVWKSIRDSGLLLCVPRKKSSSNSYGCTIGVTEDQPVVDEVMDTTASLSSLPEDDKQITTPAAENAVPPNSDGRELSDLTVKPEMVGDEDDLDDTELDDKIDRLCNDLFEKYEKKHNLNVKELPYIGGKHTIAMVKRIMAKIFKDDLLQNHLFTGKTENTPFSSLAICSVIFDAVKNRVKVKYIPQNEIEETIKYILAQAPFNLKQKLEKSSK